MDLELIETGNGGDLVKSSKDISVIYGLQNMIYLAMFGGNIEASTPTKRSDNEQDFSWWGNATLFPNDAAIQVNSLTEKRLNEVALNSSGRLLIEEAIKRDLKFMASFAIVKVATSIIGVDKLAIGIQVTQPDNLEQKEFVYIWDATNRELTDRDFIMSNPDSIGPLAGFDYLLNFSFE